VICTLGQDNICYFALEVRVKPESTSPGRMDEITPLSTKNIVIYTSLGSSLPAMSEIENVPKAQNREYVPRPRGDKEED